MHRLSARMTLSRRRAYEGFAFVAPWLVGFLAFMAFPLAYSFYMSFTNVKVGPTSIELKWKGVGNYVYAFLSDNVFPVELMSFFQQSLLVVPIIVVFSLIVGLMLNSETWGRPLFRAVFFLPVIFSTSQVVLSLFNRGAGRIAFLDRFSVAEIVNTSLPDRWAGPVLAVLDRITLVLWYSGVQILLVLAALKTINRTVYEAAAIDGAGRWEVFWKITLPALTPFIVLNIVYTIVDLSTYPFNPILESIRRSMFDVRTGMGYAAAQGWTYFSIVLLVLAAVYAFGMRNVWRQE